MTTNTPIILALDTATDACSVAVCTPEQTYSLFTIQPQAHSQLLLAMVDEIRQQAGIELGDVAAFAFGSGPGSFTGVRIAASVVQGLAFGVNKPVIPISSLQALAQQAHNFTKAEYILALLDARMQEIYCGSYKVNNSGLVAPEVADSLQKPAQLQIDSDVPYVVVGTALHVYGDVIRKQNPQLQFDTTIQHPRAQEIVQLAIAEFNSGRTLPPSAAIPTYIRDDVAQKGKKNPG